MLVVMSCSVNIKLSLTNSKGGFLIKMGRDLLSLLSWPPAKTQRRTAGDHWATPGLMSLGRVLVRCRLEMWLAGIALGTPTMGRAPLSPILTLQVWM